MSIGTSTLFFLIAVGVAIWMWKDDGFKKREFFGVTLFWIAAAATPWGGDLVVVLQQLLGNSAEAGAGAVTTVSGG